MATEPQTNPSETDPLLEKYEKFKNKAQAFETAIETKRDQLDIIRKKQHQMKHFKIYYLVKVEVMIG